MNYKFSLSLLPGAFAASEEYIKELASEGLTSADLNQIVIDLILCLLHMIFLFCIKNYVEKIFSYN